MSRSRGRPPKEPGSLRDQTLEVRVNQAEQQAFRNAADIAGLDLSEWVRERLRQASLRELRDADQDVPFLPKRKPS